MVENGFTQEFAQNMCDVLHQLTGCPVMMADREGIVFAAADRKRIGSHHPAARQVWDNEEVHAAGKEEPIATGDMQGIQMSLYAQGKILACLCILGDPEKVRPLAGLARQFVVLSLENKEQADRSEESQRNFLETLEDGYYEVDLAGNLTAFNDATCQLLGYTPAELMGMNYRQYTDKENAAKLYQLYSELYRTATPVKGTDFAYIRKDGAVRYVNVSATLIRNGQEQAVGFRGIVRDVTDRRMAERRLKESRERYRRLVELNPEAILVHRNGIIQYANPSAVKLFRAGSMEALTGESVLAFIHPDYHNQAKERWERTKQFHNGEAAAEVVEYMLVRNDRTLFFGEVVSIGIEDEGVASTLSIINDISDRKESEDKLRQMAYYDTLTGLPNRLMFRESLVTRLEHAKERSFQLAVMFIDMDRFKYINDTYGHAFGDTILKIMAERFKASVRENDLVARMGGDEFTVLLPKIAKTDDAVQVAGRILEMFRHPLEVNGEEFHLTPSIGVACYPGDGNDADTLMKHADAAMYLAKESGGNRFCFYTPSINEKSFSKMILEHDLRKALEKKNLSFSISRRSIRTAGPLSASKRCCAGTVPRKALCRRPSLFPLPKRRGLSCPWGNGC